MLILLPVILLLSTALILLILHFTRPKFKYPWLLSAGGTSLAFGSIFLWHIHFPQSFSLPSWQLVTSILYIPAWLADGISWPFALALTALAVAVIWTSVVRFENEPLSWVGTITLSAFGILAVAAENPLTLLLAWSALDLLELFAMLSSTSGEDQNEGVMIAFAVRLGGTGLVLWANMVSLSAGTPLDFRSIPPSAGVILLVAAALRLGVLPLHLPYRTDNVFRRGFGTTLRLVSAAASLALLARIPASALNSSLTPFLLILAGATALYASWMWLRASDEILGRPFWILGCASMAIGESLSGNSVGSAAWGVALILCGAVLFLFSSRRRSIIWLPLLGIWVISTLPFSLTSPAWQIGDRLSWLFIIPFLPAQAFLLAGFLRHSLHPGETSLESEAKWVKIIYPTGLLILMVPALLLGIWGWSGAHTIGLWWLAIPATIISAATLLISFRVLGGISTSGRYNQWTEIFRIKWLYSILASIDSLLRRIVDGITGSLEGEGGLLWSFLLLVLILSILSTRGH